MEWDEEEYRGKSKSQKKRESKALQETGLRLAALSAADLARMPVPQELMDAISQLRSIRSHEARRRQEQRIGSLMREVEMAPLEEALAALDGRARQATSAFHRLEIWRDQLSKGDEALFAELLDTYGVERQRFGQLVRNAKKESEKGKPKGAGRALFRFLREMVDAAS